MADDVDGGRRNWSELNPDLLELIGGALMEISDCFNFRAVCKSWRSSGEYLPLPPRRGPWLLLLPRMNPRSQNEDCHVISPLDNWRRFTLRTPYSLRMKSCHTYGSPYGCFLVIDQVTGSVSITNPLVSGSWFTLPPLLPLAESYWETAKIVRDKDSKLNVHQFYPNL